MLRHLNQLVLNTNPTPAISELINGWYPTPGGSFDGSFVPTGWAGDPDFYNGVIKPACRMCHAANNISFNTLAQAKGFASLMAGYVCGSTSFAAERNRYVMPNAKTTFDRFWNNEGGIGGDTEAQRMLAFVNSNVPAPGINSCKPPNY